MVFLSPILIGLGVWSYFSILLKESTTDDKNYVYIIHSIKHRVTVKDIKHAHQKNYLLDKYIFSTKIEDAFYHIDPNNFSPN